MKIWLISTLFVSISIWLNHNVPPFICWNPLHPRRQIFRRTWHREQIKSRSLTCTLIVVTIFIYHAISRAIHYRCLRKFHFICKIILWMFYYYSIRQHKRQHPPFINVICDGSVLYCSKVYTHTSTQIGCICVCVCAWLCVRSASECVFVDAEWRWMNVCGDLLHIYTAANTNVTYPIRIHMMVSVNNEPSRKYTER